MLTDMVALILSEYPANNDVSLCHEKLNIHLSSYKGIYRPFVLLLKGKYLLSTNIFHSLC